MQLTLLLSSPELTLANAGGKGANLSALIRGGFHVPGGFVVTTAGYDAFVEANRLAAPIAARVDAIDATDPTSYDRVSAEIRGLFARAGLPDDLRAEILSAYAEGIADAGPVAVRSSATAEDLPEASFAGQQDTFLNVIGPDALLEAVVACWSSLWTGRAMAYRQRQSIPPEDVSLAVVVQQMVAAEVAGVLFTLNPVTGDDGQMMINATWGLGEALVSGQVNPDTYIAAKESGGLLEVTIGDKAVMTAAQANGTAQVAVEAARQGQRALTNAQVGELVGLGRRIEEHFNSPQDVEWAYADGKLYVLQSRPVTTTAQPNQVPGDDAWPPLLSKKAREFDLWGQSDLGERWPDPLTPLTWSEWKPITEANMRDTFAGINEPWLAEIEWMRREYGHAYLNEGALAYAMHRGYGMPASSFAEGMGMGEVLLELYPGWKIATALRRAPLMLGMMRRWGKLIDSYEKEFAQIDRDVDGWMAQDLSGLSDEQLWHEARDVWLKRAIRTIDAHAASTSQSTTAYSQLEGTLKRFLGDGSAIQSLVTGIDGVMQSELVPALWEIAQAIRGAGLADLLLANDPQTAWGQLQAAPEAAPALALLERFLQRHGHRCATEGEFLYPRWIEAPWLVIEQVAGYLRVGGDFDPSGAEERQRAQHAAAVAGVEAQLNFLQRGFFRRGLKRLHHLVRMRDNGQHYLVKLMLPVRHCYGLLAARWAERGWLAQADDFFFLVKEEIAAVIAGGDSSGLVEKATARRAAWAYWMAQPSFPEVLDAAGKPVVTAGSDENALTGIAASGGRVTGRARVILSPQEANSLQPGDILVTRATDPGWTPVFALISGVVLEIGGQLSHGAIVAREYGLPAVVNVAGATRRIVDGETITVDGSAGTVTQAVGLGSAN
ncbi:MAG: PEP/pyruvate-binding domain-containing protein [Caldilineaceae bacterium]